jgi:hypothetical protein
VQKVSEKVDYTDCEITTFEVEKKVFFPCARQDQQSLTFFCTKFFELPNFELLHHLNENHIRYLCTKS